MTHITTSSSSKLLAYGVPCFLKLENDPRPYDFDKSEHGLGLNAVAGIEVEDSMSESQTLKVLA